MTRVIGGVAFGALAVVGMVGLADATQNRPDGSKPGTRSEVVLEVDTRGGYDRKLAAQGLWGTCQQTVDATDLESFRALGDGRFSIVVEPALGDNARKRVVGCLEDTTIDRVLGDVVEVRGLSPLRR
jgi:hypothetical protein